MSNLTEKYLSEIPGTNVDEIDAWLSDCLVDDSCLSWEDPTERFTSIELAAARELPYNELPLSLKRKAINLEARARSQAARLKAAESPALLKGKRAKKSEISEGFEVAIKLLAGPVTNSITKQVRATGKLLTEADLEKLVQKLDVLARDLGGSMRPTLRQIQQVTLVANLGLSNWPPRFRTYLQEINREAFDQFRTVKEATERERLLKKQLQDIAERAGHEGRFDAVRRERSRVALENLELEKTRQEAKVAEEQELQAVRNAKKEALQKELRSGFLAFSEKYTPVSTRDSLECEVVLEFIQSWASDKLGVTNLDEDQALAVASVLDHTQVVARAGSGKTATLAVRLCFIVLECHVNPKKVLALTFNKKAQEEITARVRRMLIFNHERVASGSVSAIALLEAIGTNDTEAKKQEQNRQIELPLIMTFHGLAHQLVMANLGADAPHQIDGGRESGSRDILDKIARGMLLRAEGSDRLRALLRQYFTDDWARLLEAELTPDQLLTIRQHLPYETLRGEMVKSWGERAVANWLFTNGVDYRYESALWTDERYIYPDFTVLAQGKRAAIIEYAGMIGDFEYDRDLDKKRAAYQKLSTPHLIVRPSEVKEEKTLASKLAEFVSDNPQIEAARMTQDQIWSEIKLRIAVGGRNSRFIAALDQFVGRSQREGLTPEYLRTEAEVRLSKDPVGREFALIAADVLEGYQAELRSQKQMDQTQALNLAIAALAGGASTVRFDGIDVELSELKFISVDEHQDFTRQFDSTLKLLHQASCAQVFAVGDDWQCINRFMGAEPALFEEFKNSFKNSVRIDMPRNYRSRAEIVQAGNGIMRAAGGSPGSSTRSRGGDFGVFFVDKLSHRSGEASLAGDLNARALRRLLIQELLQTEQGEITLLSRTNHLPWAQMGRHGQTGSAKSLDNFIDLLLPGLSPGHRSRIRTSTVHKFKGLQSEAVIVLDVQARSFPLLHSDQRFQSFFGTPIEELIEDERRLLYVAITRPVERLYLLTRTGNVSPFLSTQHLGNEKMLDDLPSGFSVHLSGQQSLLTTSLLAELEELGFLTTHSGGKAAFKAKMDLTQFVLEQGGLGKAKAALDEAPPRWLALISRSGLKWKLIPDLDD
jgi:DNA helicase-4